MITAAWIAIGSVLVALLMQEVRERRALNAVLHPKEIPAKSTFDLDDPVYRAALREVDEIAPNMPVAPPRDERDMTEAEKAIAQAAKLQRRRERLAVAEKLATMWAGTSVTSAAGQYLLPNGAYVSYEEVRRRGWVAITAEQLEDPATWRVYEYRYTK
jgi:hypothetical protein